jgi:hypothetical protein
MVSAGGQPAPTVVHQESAAAASVTPTLRLISTRPCRLWSMRRRLVPGTLFCRQSRESRRGPYANLLRDYGGGHRE